VGEKSSKPLVSIVIPSFNGRRHLEVCLSSIQNLDYSHIEVIVVDNASTDGSVEFVETKFPEVKILVNAANLGFAEGCNVGMRNAKGQYVALLNNDVEVDPNWLKELVSVAQSDPRIAICASKIIMFQNRKIFNSAGGEFDVYGSGHDRGLYEFDHGQYSCVEEVFFACGGAMLVQREILREIGLFDSRYFMYGEDVDLCWRAWLCGYKVVYVPSAIVYHKYGGTMEALTAQRLYFTNRNSLCSILKNYSFKRLAKACLRFLSLKEGEVLLFLISERANASFAILKAIIWNIGNFSETWKERVKVQMSRKVSDDRIEQRMVKESIELRRFLSGYFPRFKV
jgi:GT2 family glycosyltransferase